MNKKHLLIVFIMLKVLNELMISYIIYITNNILNILNNIF